MLELLGLPYVGSDPIASALAMDKGHAKDVMAAAGVPVAPQFLWLADPGVARGRDLDAAAPAGLCRGRTPDHAALEPLGGYPVVVKPLCEGSTVGITIVRSEADWEAAWRVGAPYAHPTRGLLVERYIAGREITVAVVADHALPVVEIVPQSGFYDFTRKYTKGQTEYRVPAPVEPEIAQRLQSLALTAYRALGCRDLARVDFRLSPDDEPYCLEVNTLPGMTEMSLVPMAARAVGIEFEELLEILSRLAIRRGTQELSVDQPQRIEQAD
jgi:D-alanine-D-alanine ligase